MGLIFGLFAAATVASLPQLEVETTLRNAHGVVRLCVTRQPASFPAGCDRDPNAIKRTVTASLQIKIVIHDLAPGDYAVALFHDENDNGRIDRVGPIPKEGFGFSQNPRLYFGPPGFKQARFTVGSSDTRQVIKLHYLL